MGGRQRESEGKRDRAAVSGVWDEVLTPKSGRGTELCCGQWSPGGRGAEGGGGGRGEPRAALWMWERAECRGTKTYQECRVDLFFSLSPPPPWFGTSVLQIMLIPARIYCQPCFLYGAVAAGSS